MSAFQTGQSSTVDCPFFSRYSQSNLQCTPETGSCLDENPPLRTKQWSRWSPVVPGGPRWSRVVPGGLSVFQQISDILHSVGDPTVCMWSLFEVVGQTGQYTMDRVDCGTSLT